MNFTEEPVVSTLPPAMSSASEDQDAILKPLSSQEALVKLHDDMREEICATEHEFSKRPLWSWLLESISFKSELSKMRWPSVVFMTAHALAHFIVAFVLKTDNLATNWIGFQGFVLTIFLIFNLAVNLWDTKLRFKELQMKAVKVAELVGQCSRDRHLLKKWRQYNWKATAARTLFIPKSPCVNQTLTYRDESCLNLPDYLLVCGDIIHLYPGDRAPGDCISLTTIGEAQNSSSSSERVALKEDEIFHSERRQQTVTSDKTRNDSRSHARLKRACRGTDFLMLSTPYINSLRISLQRSHKRPVNSIEKECFIVSRKYFETYVIPLVFFLSTIVTAIHYGYLDLTDSDQEIKTISIAYLLLRPSLTIMPFLPWMFPSFWMAVNAYGSARLICCIETQRHQKSLDDNSVDWFDELSPDWDGGKRVPSDMRARMKTHSSHMENLLATPNAAGSSDQNRHEEADLHELHNKIKFTAIFRVFVDLILGKSGHVWRSSSLLQVLGCLTSLCCIDKVGILSWSNPTPEKVLVFAKNHNTSSVGQQQQQEEEEQQQQPVEESHDDSKSNLAAPSAAENLLLLDSTSTRDSLCRVYTSNLHANSMKHSAGQQHRAEILDVSQTFNSYRAFSESMAPHQESHLQFDDPNWAKFLSNLKPLGLAIMMNNCCERSFGDYFRFYKHISYESTLRCNLTPVVKRRCICALSKLIGFSRDAVRSYKYMGLIGAYKLIDPSALNGSKLVPSLENTARLKLPFPNMICHIHRDSATGSYQATSQGTADIVLDSCVEFWNGKELVPLDESIRKKALDFYHRTSLTSYCAAFAYTPLQRDHNLRGHYIEMPAEGGCVDGASKFNSELRRLTNEKFEEQLHMQLVDAPAASRKLCEFDTLYHEGSNLSTSLSSTPVLSSPDMALSHRSQTNGTGPIITTATKKVQRRHLSAEDLHSCLIDSKNEARVLDGRKRGKRSIRSRRLEEALDELTDQVFVGMVAMQYQACPDFVGLVEQLEHACIRFVHFSKENELRSRVFSEKMGLESGWNCHISLQSDNDLDKADRSGANLSPGGLLASHRPNTCTFSPSTRIANILIGSQGGDVVPKPATGADLDSNCHDSLAASDDVVTLHSWKSLPSLVMQIIARVSGSHKHHHHHQHHQHAHNQETLIEMGKSGADVRSSDEELSESTGGTNGEPTESSASKEEAFDTLAFDMSNRAKLPKGIENIRPHLETVDNIPLQVSLFTDCTPDLTKEMIEIMQDYGEIVCVIGSASSRSNTPVFLQANASVAVEPLMPQCCTQASDRSPKRLNKLSKRRRQKSTLSTRGTAVIPNAEAPAAMDSPLLKPTNNPRDRLGIGQSRGLQNVKASEQVERFVRDDASSSSTSGSSSSSSSSSSNHVSKLSQSLSESESSDSESSSLCSSNHSDALPSSDDFLRDEEEGGPGSEEGELRIHELAKSLVHELPEPSALAGKLASLPCSYNYNRKEPVNLYSLIMEARHFTFKMKNTFVCMICFALSISSAQFLASILFLPPMLSSGLTIWLTVAVVPLMSFSLMSTTMDSQVMKIAVGKNLQLKPENITFFVICYLIKFIPSIIVVVLNFGLIIAHSCKLTGFGSSSLGPCWMFTYVRHGNSTSKEDTGEEDLLWSSHLLTAQVSAAFLMVLYFGKFITQSGQECLSRSI